MPYWGGGGYIPVPYIGPGDIVSTNATGWWGLRAYKNSVIGSNAIRLRRDSDNLEKDFTTVSGGGLDTSGINNFKGSANLFVTILYDQSGNGFNFIKTVAGAQPQFLFNAIGTLPGIFFVAASGLCMGTLGSPSVSAPYTFNAVANRTIFAGTVEIILTDSSNGDQISFTASANQFRVTANTTPITQAATDGSFHSLHGIVNDPNTLAVVDGTASASGTTGNTSIANPIQLGQFAAGFFLDGYINEAALWPVALNSTQYSAGTVSSSITTNQRSYWGF